MKGIFNGAAALFVAAVCSTAAAAQSVLVVDAAQAAGSQFTTIADAVAVAEQGDIVVVRAGVYGGVIINDKGLTITALEGARPVIEGGIHIRNLQEQHAFDLRGFEVRSIDQGYAASFEYNKGPISVEDCSFGATGTALVSGGIFAGMNESLTLVRVESEPVVNEGSSSTRAALLSFESNIHIYDGRYVGPAGVQGFFAALPGSNGFEAFGGLLFASNATFRGGRGGSGGSFLNNCSAGASGGDGLYLSGGIDAFGAGSTAIGGAGGQGGPGCSNGLAGSTVRTLGAEFTYLPNENRRLQSPLTASAAAGISQTYFGEPGEMILLALSARPMPAVFTEMFLGSIHVDSMSHIQMVGVVPPSGMFTKDLTVGGMDGSGIAGVPIYEQAAFADMLEDTLVLSSPSVVVLLDASKL